MVSESDRRGSRYPGRCRIVYSRCAAGTVKTRPGWRPAGRHVPENAAGEHWRPDTTDSMQRMLRRQIAMMHERFGPEVGRAAPRTLPICGRDFLTDVKRYLGIIA